MTALAAILLAWCATAMVTQAQGPGAARDAAGGPAESQSAAGNKAIDESQHTFWALIKASGPVGFIIIALSICGAALVFQYCYLFRTAALMPPGLADNVRELLKTGHTSQAVQVCKLQPSFLSSLLLAGLAEMDGKWSGVEKAMEDMAAEQAAKLYRRLDWLNIIANIAPMLGLLGTVIGMVVAFREVAVSQGAARAADLAAGIYLALVTTVEGLVVAIPALAVYALFRNRIDHLVEETVSAAEQVFSPLRRRQRAAAREREST
jgi:biopolymer transport protein ExbB